MPTRIRLRADPPNRPHGLLPVRRNYLGPGESGFRLALCHREMENKSKIRNERCRRKTASLIILALAFWTAGSFPEQTEQGGNQKDSAAQKPAGVPDDAGINHPEQIPGNGKQLGPEGLALVKRNGKEHGRVSSGLHLVCGGEHDAVGLLHSSAEAWRG